jgi:CRISPR-associated protein Cas1
MNFCTNHQNDAKEYIMSVTAKRQTKDILPLPVDQGQTANNRIPFDKEAYDVSCIQYERATDHKLFGSDTIIIGGYGASVKVEHRALVLRSEQATNKEKTVRLYCGAHHIRQIIILSDGGYISIDAIQWCVNQEVTVILLDWKGSLVQVLAPKHPSRTKLVYQQYMASKSDLCIDIACELIRRKIQSQIEVVKTFPERKAIEIIPKVRDKKVILENGQGRLLLSSICQFLNDSLDELSYMKTIKAIHIYESRLASVYWDAFIDVPIKWDKKAAKIVPPHWQSITGRGSPLSENGQRSINPFHSALNYALSMLESQVLQSIIMAGLEPTCGYLHTFSENRHSLVYDLMEPFRALVEAKVLALFRKTIFNKGDFYQVINGECRVNEELRRFIIATCRISQDSIDGTVHWLVETLSKYS